MFLPKRDELKRTEEIVIILLLWFLVKTCIYGCAQIMRIWCHCPLWDNLTGLLCVVLLLWLSQQNETFLWCTVAFGFLPRNGNGHQSTYQMKLSFRMFIEISQTPRVKTDIPTAPYRLTHRKLLWRVREISHYSKTIMWAFCLWVMSVCISDKLDN